MTVSTENEKHKRGLELIIAIKSDDIKTALQLIKQGADIHAENKKGKSPLDLLHQKILDLKFLRDPNISKFQELLKLVKEKLENTNNNNNTQDADPTSLKNIDELSEHDQNNTTNNAIENQSSGLKILYNNAQLFNNNSNDVEKTNRDFSR